MLISCPTCPKAYEVAASAIPPEGREVRCSSCATVWFERGVDADLVAVQVEDAPGLTTDRDGGIGDFDFSDTPVEPSGLFDASPDVGEMVDPTEARLAASIAAAVFANAPEAADDQVMPLGFSQAPERVGGPGPGPQPPILESSLRLMHGADAETTGRDAADSLLVDAGQPETGTAVIVHAPQAVSVETSTGASGGARGGARGGEAPHFRSQALIDPIAHLWSGIRSAAGSLIGRGKGDPSHRVATPGSKAAARFRARARSRARNRLTPTRIFGWVLWASSAASIAVVAVTQQAWVQDQWPRTARAYDWFTPDVGPEVTLADVRTRYAESPAGPILELRGTLINESAAPILPHLSLTTQAKVGEDQVQSISISHAPVPSRGERPFVIRAKLPEGTVRAQLAYAPDTKAPDRRQFVLQQTGSGWGSALPPMLPAQNKMR